MNRTEFGNIAIGMPGSKARTESNKKFLNEKTCSDYGRNCKSTLTPDGNGAYCVNCGDTLA